MWLILGGAGYVGRHVTRALRAAGNQCVVRDQNDGDFRRLVDPAWLGTGVDAVLLLAGTVRASSREAVLEDNLQIVRRVCDAYEHSTARPPLFFMSSLHVYARSCRPVAVTSAVLPPRSWYGAVKLACEAVLAADADRLSFPLWIGRASNLFAPTPPVNSASFVAAMRATLRTEGRIVVRQSPVRDLVLIEDFARGLMRRLEDCSARESLCVENVCTGNPVALSDVAVEAVRLWRDDGEDAEVIDASDSERDIMVGVPPPDHLWGPGPSVGDVARLVAERHSS